MLRHAGRKRKRIRSPAEEVSTDYADYTSVKTAAGRRGSTADYADDTDVITADSNVTPTGEKRSGGVSQLLPTANRELGPRALVLQDDLADGDGRRLTACGLRLFAHEVDAWRKSTDVIQPLS